MDWHQLKPILDELGRRLDHIEDYLERAGRSGYAYTRYTTAQGPVPAEVVELARSGKTIQAIKAYREATGADLESARAVILSL
jgi:ribosomal protein L7/L12